ncbi:MAG TPA: hypothetical protein VGN23_07825, partial [Verrucomicrobiae bacterium]
TPGNGRHTFQVPEGRLDFQPSLRDFSHSITVPAVETAGYYQMFLRNISLGNQKRSKTEMRPDPLDYN